MPHFKLLPLIALLSLVCAGCVAEAEEEGKAAFSDFVGTWRLSSSHDPADSTLIGSAWLTLNADSTYTGSPSTILPGDSLPGQPVSGRWKTFYYFVDRHESGISGPAISLTGVSRSATWMLGGSGIKDSLMVWTAPHTAGQEYRWVLD